MSVIDRFPHSTAELRRVKAVQFGVLSPDEIVRPPIRSPALATARQNFRVEGSSRVLLRWPSP